MEVLICPMRIQTSIKGYVCKKCYILNACSKRVSINFVHATLSWTERCCMTTTWKRKRGEKCNLLVSPENSWHEFWFTCYLSHVPLWYLYCVLKDTY